MMSHDRLLWTPSELQPCSPQTDQQMSPLSFFFRLTFSFYFVCAPSPDDGPGLQLDLKRPSLWPLRLLGIKERQHRAHLQVSVQVVHFCVVVHPRNWAVGKEAGGPRHVHLLRLLSVSCQNNLLSPSLQRDTYSGGGEEEGEGVRRWGGVMKQNFPLGFVHMLYQSQASAPSNTIKNKAVFPQCFQLGGGGGVGGVGGG